MSARFLDMAYSRAVRVEYGFQVWKEWEADIVPEVLYRWATGQPVRYGEEAREMDVYGNPENVFQSTPLKSRQSMFSLAEIQSE